MDTAIRNLVSDNIDSSSDSEGSIISVSSSVSSASYVSSIESIKSLPKKRPSSSHEIEPPLKKDKIIDIDEIRKIIYAEESDNTKVQKLKEIVEPVKHNLVNAT